MRAKIVPPADPTAGSEKAWSSVRGRKDFSLGAGRISSFDSCKRVTCGLVVISSERTSAHLSLSPRPRTFQEQIKKVSLLIRFVNAPDSKGGVQQAYSYKSDAWGPEWQWYRQQRFQQPKVHVNGSNDRGS